MTVRHVVLTVAGLAVFGLALYLFVAVRAAPAPVTATAPPPSERAPARELVDPPRLSRPAAHDAPRARRPVREVARVGAPVTEARGDESLPAPVLRPPAENLQKLDAIMAEANKAYDRGDFDEARQIASRVLTQDPRNVRMLRILVSSACIEGDSVDAQKHYLLLPAPDREQMKVRCDRYGIAFTDS